MWIGGGTCGQWIPPPEERKNPTKPIKRGRSMQLLEHPHFCCQPLQQTSGFFFVRQRGELLPEHVMPDRTATTPTTAVAVAVALLFSLFFL